MPIPTNIENLTLLANLLLAINQLKGTISSEMGWITALTNLRLVENILTDPVRTEFENLIAMKFVKIAAMIDGLHSKQDWNNDFKSWTILTNLLLFANQLTASFPTEIENLTNLSNLQLAINQMIGSIPFEIR